MSLESYKNQFQDCVVEDEDYEETKNKRYVDVVLALEQMYPTGVPCLNGSTDKVKAALVAGGHSMEDVDRVFSMIM